MSEKNIVERAKSIAVERRRNRHREGTASERVDLAIAVIHGVITREQACAVIDIPITQFWSIFGPPFFAAALRGDITVTDNRTRPSKT